MKRIFKSEPESSNYARFPQFVHEEKEVDGAIIEVMRELSPEEIIERASAGASPDLSDNSGSIVPSPDYKDSFAVVDALESEINKINPDNFKK